MIGHIVSRYRIEEKLGEGGMGVVFRAADLRLGRTVALKMIKPDLAADVMLRRRLATEAEASSVLNHKGIATLYDFESDDNNSFIVYEYKREDVAGDSSKPQAGFEGTAFDVYRHRRGRGGGTCGRGHTP